MLRNLPGTSSTHCRIQDSKQPLLVTTIKLPLPLSFPSTARLVNNTIQRLRITIRTDVVEIQIRLILVSVDMS